MSASQNDIPKKPCVVTGHTVTSKRGVFHSKLAFGQWKTPLSPVRAAGPAPNSKVFGAGVTCNDSYCAGSAAGVPVFMEI